MASFSGPLPRYQQPGLEDIEKLGVGLVEDLGVDMGTSL